MKKIIALVLLISIPFGLVVSESSKKPLLKRVEKEGYSLQPKDALWEYVKNEVEHGRIDLKVNYVEKHKDPILITLKNATVKDSLAIEGMMQELEKIFPLKKIAFFSDFTGHAYEKINEKNGNDSYVGYSYDELVSFHTQVTFTRTKPAGDGSRSSSFNLENMNVDIEHLRKNSWNKYFSSVDLDLYIDDKISIEDRATFIEYRFFEAMWKVYSFTTESKRPDFRREQEYYSSYRKSDLRKVSNEPYLRDGKFLLEKLFSTDFKNQFENYMYKTYPRRYASFFIDKEEAKQNASILVAFTGLLILILGFVLLWNKKYNHALLRYFYPILVVFMSFMSLNFLYYYMIHIEYENNSMSEILIPILWTFLIALVRSWLLWQFDKRLIDEKSTFIYQLVLKTGMTLLIFSLPIVIVGFLISDRSGVSMNVLPTLFFVVGAAFGRGLFLYLNHFSESLVKEKDVELSRLKEVNAQAEVKLLQSQINPHFLYNALNSIATLARKDGEKTEKMVLSLSDLFKYTINRKGKKSSTIKDEIEMVQNYLEIEQIRFGDRLQFNIDVPEELASVEIPMFIIQPLIENAVKHGISKNEGPGEIALKIEKSTDGITILVEDNGPDFPDGLVSGHGLQTVYDLLRLSYGEDASMRWSNEPEKGIVIFIKI